MTVEPIRKVLPYLSIVVVIAAIYVAYTFYARHDSDQRLQREEVAKKRASDEDTLRRIGEPEMKISSFYATPNVIGKGQTAQLCYDVTNAEKVELAPPVERVWPSLSRCFEVSPRATTRYTLSAWDKESHSAQQSTEIAVR